VEAHADDILLDFFRRRRPAAKGAILVNSVAAAHRIAARLRPIFQAEGLTLELNTGLTSEALRKVSRESDLLVGTSTVDVGVDFRINFLVFESGDAATFLQRLGRLGRHPDDGRDHRFDDFQAHALVPDFILERLSPVHLVEGSQYTREELAAAIREVYPESARFEEYARHWGRFQSTRVLLALARGPVRDTYADARRNLAEQYWRVFRINSNEARRAYKDFEVNQKPLLEEARSFRGGSPLQCALINLTEPSRPIQRYDLLSLLANADLDWLEREEFEAELAARRLDPPFNLDAPVAFFRLRGFAASRRALGVRLARPLEAWPPEKWGEPLVLQGIALDADGLPWLNALNRRLTRRHLVVTFCRAPAGELRRRLRVPPLLPLYDFLSSDGVTGAIAFARPALLFHTALRRARYDCSGGGGGAILL
jgi:CRISPR-associated endonuclease/helicase Cas3